MMKNKLTTYECDRLRNILELIVKNNMGFFKIIHEQDAQYLNNLIQQGKFDTVHDYVEDFWDEQMKIKVCKLSKRELQALILNIYETATINYCGETFEDRITWIQHNIEKTVGYVETINTTEEYS